MNRLTGTTRGGVFSCRAGEFAEHRKIMHGIGTDEWPPQFRHIVHQHVAERAFQPDLRLAVGLAMQHRLVVQQRSEEHTSELQSLMRSSYAVFCLNTKN